MRHACGGLVRERIGTSPEAYRRLLNWLPVQSRYSERDLTGPYGTPLFEELLKLGPFSSTIEVEAKARKAERASQERAEDAARKRKKRKLLLASGEVHPWYLDALFHAYETRLFLLWEAAQRCDQAPRYVVKLSYDSCAMTTEVWLARTLLNWTKQDVRPGALARWLVTSGFRDGNHRVLRQRIPGDVARIAKLENERWLGFSFPLWQPFDPEALIASGKVTLSSAQP